MCNATKEYKWPNKDTKAACANEIYAVGTIYCKPTWRRRNGSRANKSGDSHTMHIFTIRLV